MRSAPSKKTPAKKTPSGKTHLSVKKPTATTSAKTTTKVKKPTAKVAAPTRGAPSAEMVVEQVFEESGFQVEKNVLHPDFIQWVVDVPEEETFDLTAQLLGGEQFVFYLEFRSVVESPRIDAAMELVTRMNHGLALGCFELDLESRRIRLRHSIDGRGARFERALVANIILGSMDLSVAYEPAIASVLEGAMSPLEALQRLEEEDGEDLVFFEADDADEAGGADAEDP